MSKPPPLPSRPATHQAYGAPPALPARRKGSAPVPRPARPLPTPSSTTPPPLPHRPTLAPAPAPPPRRGSRAERPVSMPVHRPNPTPQPVSQRPMSMHLSPSTGKKSPLTIFSTENYMLCHNNNRSYSDPLVFEKKNGHLGGIVPYDKDKHIVNNAYSTFVEGQFILGILTLEGASYLVVVTQSEVRGVIEGKKIFVITRAKFLSFKRNSQWAGMNAKNVPEYVEVEKFVNSGLLYFSFSYHLTLSQQYQVENDVEAENKPMWKLADRRFFWNYYLSRHFIKKRLHDWIVPVIRGHANCETHMMGAEQIPMEFAVLSRISCMRAGTRYNARGINDDGNVANFVETEQIIVARGQLFSFLQVRGSVPVFWEQRFTHGNYKAQVSRSAEATVPAFKKHFDDQLDRYKAIQIVNLLDKKKQELHIANAYGQQLTRYDRVSEGTVEYTHFDFHAETKGQKFENIIRLLPLLERNIDGYGYFMRSGDGELITRQNGSFRTNCLDCLDRTNVVQGFIAWQSLKRQLPQLGLTVPSQTGTFGLAWKNIWANNGDNVSLSYAGTGAMKSSFTRTGKRSFMGLLDDVEKSVTRLYIGATKDDSKQEAIDQFLGNIENDIAEDDLTSEERWVSKQLEFRSSSFTRIEKEQLFIGSWNVGAAPPSRSTNLGEWLMPDVSGIDHDSISIYIIGFQEIVELSSSSMLQAEEKNLRQWEQTIKSFINSKRKGIPVVTAGFVQLVGIGIIALVAENRLGDFGNFIVEKSKVGGGGFIGNKGALVARFDFLATSFACVCAHLAAGQKHALDRIADYHNIINKTHFIGAPSTRTILEHDYVFFFGDLNFRIDLLRSEVLMKINQKDLASLLDQDQLNKARKNQQLFVGFTEEPITFDPTYKYDEGTDRYDTSEKARVPAWCDRILWKVGTDSLKLEQLVYSRGELYESDHRPIKALFRLDIKEIDSALHNEVEKELYKIASTLSPQEIADPDTPYGNVMTSPPPRPASVAKSTHSAPVSSSPTPALGFAPPPPSRGRASKTSSSSSRSSASSRRDLPPPLAPTPSAAPTTVVTNSSRLPMFAMDDAPPIPTSTPAAAPPVPVQLTQTQQDIEKYKASLESIRDKLADGFGFEPIIKAATNLCASTVKTLLHLLQTIPSNAHANQLSVDLVAGVEAVANSARNAVTNPTDNVAHAQLIADVQAIVDSLTNALPFVK